MGIKNLFKKDHKVVYSTEEKSYADKMAETEEMATEEPVHDQETEEEKAKKRLEEFDKKRYRAELEKLEIEQVEKLKRAQMDTRESSNHDAERPEETNIEAETEDQVFSGKECQEEQQENKQQEEQDDVEQQKEILKAIENETDSVEEKTQETMVIGKGTELTGNLNSEEAIELLGTVNGNITSKADIKLLGNVCGDVRSLGVEVSNSSIQGNITADKKITVDSSSTIIGNISAEEIIVNGKIKGNLKAAESIQIKENTVFIGNASAKVISVAPGAVIRGKVEITTDHKEDQIFSAITVENNISVGERRKPDGFSIPIQ